MALAFTVVAGGLLTSCGEEGVWNGSDSEGKITLSLQTDGSVVRATRGDDSKASIIPDASDFSIVLTKQDGSESKKWDSPDLFNQETTFKSGDYTIEAIHGDIDKEGFDAPHYYASQDLTVKPGDDTGVHLTASLANAMVSIRYTDDLKANFTSYHATIRSEGHDYLVFTQDETRPVYVSPSNVELNLTLTNTSGKTVTIQPAEFVAEAKHHYVITIGVNGEASIGDLKLAITFEENIVDAEIIDVVLSEELFNAPPPTIEARDFVSDTPAEYIASMPLDGINPRFLLYAFAGFKEAKLIVKSKDDSYNPVFGEEIDLLGADEENQAKVTSTGVDVRGLFRNPDKMAEVRLKGFVEKLPKGEYEVMMKVKDAMTRTNDTDNPIRFKVIITDLDVIIVPVGKMPYNSKEHDFYVFSNYKDIVKVSDFRRLKQTNSFDNLEVNADAAQSVVPSEIGADYAGYAYGYKCHFKIPDSAFVNMGGVQRDMTELQLYYKNETSPRASAPIALQFPEYSLKVDAMAKKIKVKIIPKDPNDLSILSIIKSGIIFFRGDKQTAEDRITRLSGDIIEVHFMDSNTDYSNVTSTLGVANNRKTFAVAVPNFKTEEEKPIPNGNFANTTQTINISGVQVGGQYQVWPGNYTLKSSIVCSEATGWASLNSYTCYTGSKNKNTWFMVPSTYVENGIAYIRSVGYNHDGTTPARSGGAANTKYYCENAPGQGDLKKSRGEMFLGSYSYNGNGLDEGRKEGTAFSSRPLALKFDYMYTPLNGEVAECTVELYKGNRLIASKTAKYKSTNGSWKENEWIEFSTYPFDDGTTGPKITTAVVKFLSVESDTDADKITITIPTGSALNEGTGLGNHTISANNYHALAKGSELRIRNVEFKYTSKAHSGE